MIRPPADDTGDRALPATRFSRGDRRWCACLTTLRDGGVLSLYMGPHTWGRTRNDRQLPPDQAPGSCVDALRIETLGSPRFAGEPNLRTPQRPAPRGDGCITILVSRARANTGSGWASQPIGWPSPDQRARGPARCRGLIGWIRSTCMQSLLDASLVSWLAHLKAAAESTP